MLEHPLYQLAKLMAMGWEYPVAYEFIVAMFKLWDVAEAAAYVELMLGIDRASIIGAALQTGYPPKTGYA